MPKSAFHPAKGCALLIPSGPNDKKHLYFILTDQCADSCHLLVGISSVPNVGFFDKTCLLSPKDHPFLKHDSFVFYRRPEILRSSKISRFVELGYYTVKQEAGPDLISKISQGIMDSHFTPQHYQNYYRDQLT